MDWLNEDALSVNIGQRIRQLREERDLSIRALSRASGISANALSMIERGRSSPSVSTLYKVAGALEIPITALFSSEPGRTEVVFKKAAGRIRVPFTRGLWEGLGGEQFNGPVEPFALTLESGSSSGPYPIVHSGHEFVLCLRGQLEYIVEDQQHLLEPGDSLIFASRLQHRWRNPGPTVTNAIVIISGFEQGERPGEHHLLKASNEGSAPEQDQDQSDES